MTCSEVPNTEAISGLVLPCHTRVATRSSVRFSCSLGDMIHVLLFKYRGGQDDALAALFNSCAQEERSQVLFYGARADLEFCRDFLVAAALDQQFQHVLIAACDFDLFKA